MAVPVDLPDLSGLAGGQWRDVRPIGPVCCHAKAPMAGAPDAPGPAQASEGSRARSRGAIQSTNARTRKGRSLP